MLSLRLVRLIEEHAHALSHGLVEQLRADPRLPNLARVPREELESTVTDFYANLSRWLGHRADRSVEEVYRAMGWHRHHEGVPLSEAYWALVRTRTWIYDYAHRVGLPDTALDLAAEEELYLLLGSFFDEATYHLIRGYEREQDFQRRLAAERAAEALGA